MGVGKSMRTVALITTLVVICTGSTASASFKKCYSSCYEDCTDASGERMWCAAKCVAKCLKHRVIAPHGNHFCDYNIDCAVKICSPFQNDVDKVEDCVRKCGKNDCFQSPISIGKN